MDRSSNLEINGFLVLFFLACSSRLFGVFHLCLFDSCYLAFSFIGWLSTRHRLVNPIINVLFGVMMFVFQDLDGVTFVAYSFISSSPLRRFYFSEIVLFVRI